MYQYSTINTVGVKNTAYYRTKTSTLDYKNAPSTEQMVVYFKKIYFVGTHDVLHVLSLYDSTLCTPRATTAAHQACWLQPVRVRRARVYSIICHLSLLLLLSPPPRFRLKEQRAS